MVYRTRPPAYEKSTGEFQVQSGFAKPKIMRKMFSSGRPDLNRGPPAPKVRAETLSSWFV